MILHDLVGNEEHDAYKNLSIDNLQRQYSFLRSLVNAHLALNRPMISSSVILALNAHAIACLHSHAGQYRPCSVTVGKYIPPDYYRVPELMNSFINTVNHHWNTTDDLVLAAFVLWQLNLIHPFINGNGRTARALCYFVLCLKAGRWLQGETLVPELIRKNRDEYVELLREADALAASGDPTHLAKLHAFLQRLVDEQLASAEDAAPQA